MSEDKNDLLENRNERPPQKKLSRRDFLKVGPLIILAGGALACRLPLETETPENEATSPPPQPTETAKTTADTSTPPQEIPSTFPTPDFWEGKEIPKEMPSNELYQGGLEAIKKAQQDSRILDINYWKEQLHLPDKYIKASHRAIAEDVNGAIADLSGTSTGFGTSLMFTTQAELGWGEQDLIFGLTQGHIFTNSESGRTATGLTLRQLHLNKADIKIPHVSWFSIDGLDASVFAFKKPKNIEFTMFGLEKFAFGSTKDNLSIAKGLVMPASIEVTGYMGVSGPPDRMVIPPYSSWPRGIHLRIPSSTGCSGSSLVNDESKVFATVHGLYPTVSQDPSNPNKYIYDGFGTFADVLPSEEAMLLACMSSQMDYLNRFGYS